MLIDPLTDADCTCLRTLAITVHRPCCATHTDHLTKVVQTLYLVYIYPPMRRVVLRLPTCAFYQASFQPGSRCSNHPRHRQYLLGSRLPRPRFLPRPSPSSRPSSASIPGTLNNTLALVLVYTLVGILPNTLNDILALVFVYTLVGIFALLLLASLVYFALRCLEPPSPNP